MVMFANVINNVKNTFSRYLLRLLNFLLVSAILVINVTITHLSSVFVENIYLFFFYHPMSQDDTKILKKYISGIYIIVMYLIVYISKSITIGKQILYANNLRPIPTENFIVYVCENVLFYSFCLTNSFILFQIWNQKQLLVICVAIGYFIYGSMCFIQFLTEANCYFVNLQEYEHLMEEGVNAFLAVQSDIPYNLLEIYIETEVDSY
ncbi:Hypothetical protein SRAE_X000007000 [Strongyloides ratti]|uniref:Uncharacterized protein n=1 Tax=Strongyloides ratti TaxID=34506 RepID=A0A090LT27_STRRB|nr:Hypothetical protein SRAE_X000007000 [Strongyloides ratti]CEF70739.1 Hypothetical protein SRAE_X000007000 [Strongyloides ratti]